MRNRRFLIEHTYFGNTSFRFSGKAGELFKLYFVAGGVAAIGGILCFFLIEIIQSLITGLFTGVFSGSIPAVLLVPLQAGVLLGIYCFLKAKRERFYWSNTHFDTARFRSTLTVGQVFLVVVGNLLLLICTLGLAWPLTQVRSWRLRFENLRLEGKMDLEAIAQEAKLVPPATGEQFADFLDLDLGLF